jgi:hypothetical protein
MTRLEANNDNRNAREFAAEDQRKLRENWAAFVWVIVLLAGAFWLLTELVANARLQECAARSHRNCTAIETPIPPQR